MTARGGHLASRATTVLKDRLIGVTRPREQAGSLAQGIKALGGNVLLFPVLDIAPVWAPDRFDDVAARLGDFDLAFFVSPNAVRYGLDALLARRDWPGSLAVATVGKGSERALAERGFAWVVAPASGFDSEAVLALPEFAADAIRGRRVLVLRGDGGRDLLGETLRARGATVEYLSCYCRSCPVIDPGIMLQPAREGRLDALVLTSSEGVRNLRALVGDESIHLLAEVPVFASHPRIAAQSRDCGFGHVVETEAGDEGILRALTRHFG